MSAQPVVLLVDDDPTSLAMLTGMLRQEGFETLGASTVPLPFDIIFCRNVAIYFSEQDKIHLFKSICRVMAPDGYLIIGATESITGLCPEFEAKRYLRSVFYQLRNGG
jgi:chemotaxis protein methyltransferase CheR